MAKSIVLFSDGTGNSSAKLFKTNVWRMYEAVDLGPADKPGERTQIAYYDNGVGTSSLKFLAVLGGIFGIGLKRNILTIYRFLCRNYEPGDRIYAFGFSRGAFTMRLVVGLIGNQGIVDFDDEADLVRQSHDAYRAFTRRNVPNFFPLLTWAARALQDLVLWVSRTIRRCKPFRPSPDRDVPVAFVGVWDTVAAYGGPFAELTRAIDNWIWPLTMTDQQLCDNVEVARHALALDDERDSFQPVLWDEVHESRHAQAAAEAEKAATTGEEREKQRRLKEKFSGRIRQVWFAGMHADVGGGYPDESLSFVPLLWMMREAGQTGLRLLPDFVKRVQDLSTPLGPIHNSREGFGSYYRYQPRKVAAFLHPRGDGSQKLLDQTMILRDPVIGEKRHRPQGLLMTCHVHDSVGARIESGTDSYAPISLPENFDITPPPAPPALDGTEPRQPLITEAVRTRLKAVQAKRYLHQENAWDLVLYRRLVYFATVAATILLLAIPWLQGAAIEVEKLCDDDRCILPDIISQLKIFLPSFAERWIDSYADQPLLFVILVVVIASLLATGRAIELKLRDRSLRIWKAALDRGPWPGHDKPSTARRIRDSYFYQRLFRDLKWYVLPTILGIAMVLTLLYGLAIVATQITLVYLEPRDYFCTDEPVATPELGSAERTIDIADRCTAMHARVRAGQTYELTLDLPIAGDGNPSLWRDGERTQVTPQGASASALPGIVGYAGAPFRRVASAGYLQPLIEIRGVESRNRWFPDVHISAIEPRAVKSQPGRYVARFTAQRDGSLHLFVNDVAPPFGLSGFFYGNNVGTARVTVRRVEPE